MNGKNNKLKPNWKIIFSKLLKLKYKIIKNVICIKLTIEKKIIKNIQIFKKELFK